MGSNFLWLLEAGAVFFCSAGSRVAPVAGVWGWGAPGPRTTHSRGEKDAVLEKTKRAIEAQFQLLLKLRLRWQSLAARTPRSAAFYRPWYSHRSASQKLTNSMSARITRSHQAVHCTRSCWGDCAIRILCPVLTKAG